MELSPHLSFQDAFCVTAAAGLVSQRLECECVALMPQSYRRPMSSLNRPRLAELSIYSACFWWCLPFCRYYSSHIARLWAQLCSIHLGFTSPLCSHAYSDIGFLPCIRLPITLGRCYAKCPNFNSLFHRTGERIICIYESCMRNTVM